jgi:hypothetical protein
MTFRPVESESQPHRRENLIWFELSPDLIQSEDKDILKQLKQLLSFKDSSSRKYELYLLIHLRLDEISCNGANWKFGIKEGYLELYFVGCNLPRKTWILVPKIHEYVTRKRKKTWSKKAEANFNVSASDKETKAGLTINWGGTQGGEEEDIDELTQADMNGSETNPRITFTAQKPNPDGKLVFNGKFDTMLGIVEITASQSEIHGKFRVDSDGLVITHKNNQPIPPQNLPLIIQRFLFPDLIQEKLKTLTGDYLSYVKLCSS